MLGPIEDAAFFGALLSSMPRYDSEQQRAEQELIISLIRFFFPKIERLVRIIQADRVHPGKLLNYKFEGFEKIEDAFHLMDTKPKDLIKPYVLI